MIWNHHSSCFEPLAVGILPCIAVWCWSHCLSSPGFHPAQRTTTNYSRMASIPAGGSLVATTDYYRRRIGSTSSSSSCGSSEYSGEVIPHHPGLPKQDSGHWWSSFFFGKQPGMTPLTEEAQQKARVQGAVTNGQITCVAREMVMQRQVSESSDAGTSSWSCSSLWSTMGGGRGKSDQWPTLGDGRMSR